MHQRDSWDSSSLTLTHLVPPTLTTLVSLRTLLLEQRFILQNCLGPDNTTCLPTPPGTPPNSQAWPVTYRQNEEPTQASSSAVSPPHLPVPQPVRAMTSGVPMSPPLQHSITPPVSPLSNNPLSPSYCGSENMSTHSFCDSEDSVTCSFKSACGSNASNISFHSSQSMQSAGQHITLLTNITEDSKEEDEEENVTKEDQQPELNEEQEMEISMRLWQQRFLSVFFWPSVMSLQRYITHLKFPPTQSYKYKCWKKERYGACCKLSLVLNIDELFASHNFVCVMWASCLLLYYIKWKQSYYNMSCKLVMHKALIIALKILREG